MGWSNTSHQIIPCTCSPGFLPGSSRVDLQLQAWRSEQGSAWIIHPGRVSGGVVAAGSFRPGLTQEEVEEQVEVEVEVHVEAQVSHRRAPRAILQIGKVL